ncbi:MAG TPA: pentapeptide repeat-containing protein, partial [Bryobacteraceae bacterium]
MHRRKVGDPDPGLRDVDFQGASLAGCDLRYLDFQGADVRDCDLRAANLQGADLRGALFTPEKIILAANWPLARYSNPADLSLPVDHNERLQNKSFEDQSLRHVNFTDADLDSYNLDHARLAGSSFYDASLVGARLGNVGDLAAWQFRGAVLTGARLPEAIKKFEGLKAVEANTKVAARSFTATILACLYCWLTIGTTTDAEFFGAEHSTALPFLQTKISPYGFYAVAPLLLAVTFLYLQFSLQQLWEAFASLPAYFDDGRALHERSAPFFLSAVVRTQFRRLREKAPGLAKWQTRFAWLLGWWVVPFTIALLWWRSLVARLAWLTAIQLVSLGVTVAASLFFMSIAGATLRGVPVAYFDNWRQWLLRGWFPRKFVWAALVTAGLSVFSALA